MALRTLEPDSKICRFFKVLTLKVPITTAADEIRKYFFIVFRDIRLDISREPSANQNNETN